MEKLWSPWRSSYIQSFKTKKENSSCVFCEALRMDPAAKECLIVHKGKNAFIMLNMFPYNSGHLMIIPNRHLSFYNDLRDEEIMEIMTLNRITIKALDKLMKPHGYNFGANFGKAAGAGIDDHLHFHVLPRWTGDTNFMPALGEVKIISQDLLETKNDLIKIFSGIPAEDV